MSAQAKSRIRFTPVQLKARHDGWTAARQRLFIDTLAATRSIAEACRAAGMSRMSAYKLRDHPGAGEFRSAWREALELDFLTERGGSSRSLQRVRRLAKRYKVDEAREAYTPPVSPPSPPSRSSNWSTWETLLAQLRSSR